MAHKCSNCGKEHVGWPALTFSSPAPYNDLSEEEQESIAKLSNDFCVIEHPDQTDRFIRCTLTQKVIDHCDDLQYGIWVSLSEASYNDYYDNFESTEHITQYFGWLCSRIPPYESTLSIPMTVRTKSGNSRPEVTPHKDFEHPFVKDYYTGITESEAVRRVEQMLEKQNT